MSSLTGSKGFSCVLHPSVAAAESGPTGEGTAVLLAPLDVRPWLAEAKDDRHGIGYSGIQEDRVGEMKGKARSTGVHGLFGQVETNHTHTHTHTHTQLLKLIMILFFCHCLSVLVWDLIVLVERRYGKYWN